MADGIKISVNNLPQVKQQLAALGQQYVAKVNKFLDKHAQNIATKAKNKSNFPFDEGTLKDSISAETKDPLEKHIVANTPYAAFVEFGTGKYAAETVGNLPQDWQEYAASFRGLKGNGNFDDLVKRIAEWIGRKGKFGDTALQGTFSVKTRKRTGNKTANQNADLKLAYVIARSILRNGIHAQPFLYPAYASELQEIKNDLPNIFK